MEDYKVVFKIANNEIRIFGIIHRKEVCKKVGKRMP